MPHMTEADIEFTLIGMRIELNDSVKNRAKYDPWAHNLCFLSVLTDLGHALRFYSYSDQSSLSDRSIRYLANQGLEFVPLIDYTIEFGVNCGGMGQYHTEPKLFRNVLGRPGLIEHVREIILASEIDVCKTCMPYTVQAFRQLYPTVSVVVREFGMVPSQDKPPTYPIFQATQGSNPF